MLHSRQQRVGVGTPSEDLPAGRLPVRPPGAGTGATQRAATAAILFLTCVFGAMWLNANRQLSTEAKQAHSSAGSSSVSSAISDLERNAQGALRRFAVDIDRIHDKLEFAKAGMDLKTQRGRDNIRDHLVMSCYDPGLPAPLSIPTIAHVTYPILDRAGGSAGENLEHMLEWFPLPNFTKAPSDPPALANAAINHLVMQAHHRREAKSEEVVAQAIGVVANRNDLRFIACHGKDDLVCQFVMKSGYWEIRFLDILLHVMVSLRYLRQRKMEEATRSSNQSTLGLSRVDQEHAVEYIDVGANVGALAWSIHLANFDVTAFEAMPHNAQLLSISKCVNGLRNPFSPRWGALRELAGFNVSSEGGDRRSNIAAARENAKSAATKRMLAILGGAVVETPKELRLAKYSRTRDATRLLKRRGRNSVDARDDEHQFHIVHSALGATTSQSGDASVLANRSGTKPCALVSEESNFGDAMLVCNDEARLNNLLNRSYKVRSWVSLSTLDSFVSMWNHSLVSAERLRDYDTAFGLESGRISNGSTADSRILPVLPHRRDYILKMDVEGFEPHVVAGAVQFLKDVRTRPKVILTEVWIGFNITAYIFFMQDAYGYRVYSPGHHGWLLKPTDVTRYHRDMLASKWKVVDNLFLVAPGYETLLPAEDQPHVAGGGDGGGGY